MGSDSQDSHRKHHRSTSDDDSPEISKRHKHRHHRHHRHHHHHHRSKKDDSKKNEISAENREVIVEDVRDIITKKPLDDYDMEEGEIVEDEVESGEFKAGDDDRNDFDDSYMSVDDDASRKSSRNLKSPKSEDDELPVLERIANGDIASRSSKGESRSHSRHKSPRRESRKEKERHRSTTKNTVPDAMEVDDDEYGDRRNSHSYKVEEVRRETTKRSSHGRNHVDTTSETKRSESPQQRRGRSQSILHDSHLKTRHHHERDERLYDNERGRYDIDDERDSRGSTHQRSNGGEKAKDKKGVDREASKERSERDHDKERHSYRSRDREMEDSVRDRERRRERKSDRDRNGSLDRDFDRERDRRREKDRGRSRDRASERERRRDDSVSMHRDMGRDRYREKARDDEDNRSRRYHKHDDHDDVNGNRDRRRGYDEVENGKERKKKRDLENDHASRVDSRKEIEDGMHRDDEETIMLKPVEQEEDVDKIKEESRKRREAILQKYKAKQSQQQHREEEAVPMVPKVSNEQPTAQPSQSSTSENAVQEDRNGVKDNGRSLMGIDLIAVERSNVGLGEGSPKSEKSNDMFCDDIFGDSPTGVRKMGKGDGLPLERSGLHDNWDDPEGYYSFRFGEILDSRYEITAPHGKGVFSTVVRAKDLKAAIGDPENVAIKIIRNNETMLKAGTEELVILKKLVGADPDDRRHCVRYLSHFKYRNHLCIVFESLHMNLREVLKKFGRNIGLKLTAVRTYAKQLFIALKHLRNCGVLHCDIKPDNMLVNEAKNVLKLCDFGNAMFAGKNEITPYLVSRFYRAPEIILGLPYDHPMDIWSVGCCLYELYTGKVLFPGPTNNDMLRLHMELKGPFPKKMLRKGAFIGQHFDQDLNFLALEEDPVTKKAIRRLMINIKPKDIGDIIKGSTGEDPKMLVNFKDLLDKIFVLDPDKRLTVSQALNHPFITGK